MVRILLLDCSGGLAERLKSQGFDVESGTIGFSAGRRQLPSQVYEKDIFIYDPTWLLKKEGKYIQEKDIEDWSPEYSLRYLEDCILRGATFLIFVNRVADEVEGENAAYRWIPFMPPISLTKDTVVGVSSFTDYPNYKCKYLAPIVTVAKLDIPVLQRIEAPKADYPPDIFPLFWNGRGDKLGVLMLRGRGALIILPKFKSNEEIAETFLHRVMPEIYDLKARIGLVDKYVSPAEQETLGEVVALEGVMQHTEGLLGDAKAKVATAKREKSNTINADPTAKQILVYYDAALRQDDVALFYLYKVIESIENKYGGEANGIAALGFQSEWKFVKKTANASYGDMRHAPKPGDVIKKWSDAEIKACFEATERVILAYFATLFSPAST